MDVDAPSYPEPGGRDRVQAAVKTGLNLVPYFGGALATLFDAVIEPAIERRQREWGNCVAEMVDDIQRRLGRIEDLGGNDEWISALRMHHVLRPEPTSMRSGSFFVGSS